MAEVAHAPAASDGAVLSQSQMQNNLSAAKEARKRAELDAQLLANRIALLRQEEEKACKKIDETRKRAKEITELRTQNEQKFAAKSDFYQEKWEAMRSAQAENSHNRDRAKAVRDATMQGIMDVRQANAQKAKQQSHQFLLQKKEREAAERQANIDRGNHIKQQKYEAKRKLEEDRLTQLEKFRVDYESRTGQEDLLRSRTDALVAKMEKEEMELIQRLQNTQFIQRDAYEALEAALGQTAVGHQPTPNSRSAGAGGRAGAKVEPRPAA